MNTTCSEDEDMRFREFFTLTSGDFGFLWKYQMLLGILVILSGIAILIFPEILVALVATATMMIGVGLIGSAWRIRRLQERNRGASYVEVFEW
jgi:hypothetical protein